MSHIVYDNQYHHNRNYGCRWHEIIYNGYRSLVLENEKLRVTILVDKGTDVVELLYKPMDVDFMWRSPVEVNAQAGPSTMPRQAGNFLDVYEGGWQELLPSITHPTNYKGMELGLHGEVAFLPWQYEIIEDTPYEVKVRFSVRLQRSPLLVTKTLTIKSGQSVLDFDETVTNEGDEEFRMMWGHHPTYGKPFLDEHCVIDLPGGAVGQMYQTDFSGNSPFECDMEFDWPMARDKQGRMVDLSHVMPPQRKTAFNMYVKELSEAWYAITNRRQGVGIGFTWDLDVFKYLLIWSVYRGYYNSPFFGRTYNMAIELYSAMPDSLDRVIELGRDIRLAPQAAISTSFATIVYETAARVTGFDDAHQPLTD